MSEKPILFTVEMVKAILEGRKTVTRRVIDLPDDVLWDFTGVMKDGSYRFSHQGDKDLIDGLCFRKSRYQVGDLPWVKETFLIMDWANRDRVESDHSDIHIQYKASDSNYRPDSPRYIGHSVKKRCPEFINDAVRIYLREVKKSKHAWRLPWISSRFMPKWAARTWLEVVSVRPERLQDITEEDCWKESIDKHEAEKLPYINKLGVGCATATYSNQWDSINAKRGYPWEGNWWVFRYEFKEAKRQ